jgi:hypothetical protein
VNAVPNVKSEAQSTTMTEDRSGRTEDRSAMIEDRSAMIEDRSAMIEDRNVQIEGLSAMIEGLSGMIEDRSGQTEDRTGNHDRLSVGLEGGSMILMSRVMSRILSKGLTRGWIQVDLSGLRAGGSHAGDELVGGKKTVINKTVIKPMRGMVVGVRN